jgi:hypothetical protein
MAHLVESGQLTLEDVKEAEELLRKPERKDEPKLDRYSRRGTPIVRVLGTPVLPIDGIL